MLIDFTQSDLAATRFAVSPLGETIASYVALRMPDKNPLVLPWVREAEQRVADAEFALLDRLLIDPMAAGSFMFADFLVSYPKQVDTSIDDELQALAATPPDEVRADIEENYAALPLDPYRAFLDDPRAAMAALAEEVEAFWLAAVAPDWPGIRTILENDILYRAHLLTDGGLGPLFASLGTGYTFDGARLHVNGLCDVEWALTGNGIVLTPSVFTKTVGAAFKPGRAVLRYRARGVAMAFADAPFRPQEALVGLLGEPRAALLTRLEMPATTGDLATHFAVTPGAISQQLSWLKGAGLVATRRVGVRSMHTLTVVGQGVLDAYQHADRVPIPWQQVVADAGSDASRGGAVSG